MLELACTICATPAADALREAMLHAGFGWAALNALSPLFLLSALLGGWQLRIYQGP